MARNWVRLLPAVACLACVSCSETAVHQVPAVDPGSRVVAAPPVVDDSNPLDGIWFGSWGGGERDGTVFQPVIAEMVIQGDHVELHGFRIAGTLIGTARFDTKGRKLNVTPAAVRAGDPPPKTIEFTCQLDGDNLTLTDSENIPTSLQRRRTEDKPLANGEVEFVLAEGIDSTGALLVTKFGRLLVGQSAQTSYEPQKRSMKLQQATILSIQETGLRKVSIDEARVLARRPTPVVLAYREDDQPALGAAHHLWKDVGNPQPGDEAVGQTLSRILRPGTLVFILPARDKVPAP
jgi:hypothetical protein